MKNNIIKKYNDFLNEKISDKLSGFDEIGLKKQYEKGEIDIFRYIKLCKENNLQLPPIDYLYNIIYNKCIKIFGSFDKYLILKECCRLNVPELLEKVLNENQYKTTDFNSYLSYINDLDCLKIMINHGANIYYDTDNEYVLKTSIKNNNFEIFKYYVDNCKFRIQQECFKSICIYDRDDMMEYIFKNINLSELEQSKVLSQIIYSNNIDMLILLVEYCNLDVNINNSKALNEAIFYERSDIVEYLLKHGISIKNIKIRDIKYCLDNDDYTTIKLLIKNGFVLSDIELNNLANYKDISIEYFKQLIYN